MKLTNKLLVGLLSVNLLFAGNGIYASAANISYAASTSTVSSDKFNQQKAQLQFAVDDMVNVVNTNAYYNYASQQSKDNYEKAIGNATTILARGDSASYEDLRNATIRINEAKKQVEIEANKIAQKQKLQKAINDNKTQVAAAKMVLTNYPKTVAKVRPQLEQIIKRSESLVAKAEAILKTL